MKELGEARGIARFNLPSTSCPPPVGTICEAVSNAPIPFHRVWQSGEELRYLAEAMAVGIESDGRFTKACAEWLERRFRIARVLPTPSCTAALEMSALLAGLGPGDEVIMPSFTFTSTANAVVLRGAQPIFVDIRTDTLNIDERLIEAAITPRTKAIIVVHYAGVACEMDTIRRIASGHGLLLVEDAAQAVDAFYRGRALGSLGDLAAFSFHATKNSVSGEGGALCINDPHLIERAEIIREKGTNRSRYIRGETKKYEWVDLGGSHLPSELSCAFLYAQLQHLDVIRARRQEIYRLYQLGLSALAETGDLQLPHVPPECDSNHHLFHVLLPDVAVRDALKAHLTQHQIGAASHYVPLHISPMGRSLGYRSGLLPVTESIHERLLRLPLYVGLTPTEAHIVVERVHEFFRTAATHVSAPHLTRLTPVPVDSLSSKLI